MPMRRCVVDNKLIWVHLLTAADYSHKGDWTCSWECWKKIAAAEEIGLRWVYINE